MVAEVDSSEAVEKRKPSEKRMESDLPVSTGDTSIGATAASATSSELSLLSRNVIENDHERSSPRSISKNIQTSSSFVVKVPDLESGSSNSLGNIASKRACKPTVDFQEKTEIDQQTITTEESMMPIVTSMRTRNDCPNQYEISFQSMTYPPASNSKSVSLATAKSSPNQMIPSLATNGGDLHSHTVQKLNQPSQGTHQLSSSKRSGLETGKSIHVDTSHSVSNKIVSSQDITTTNETCTSRELNSIGYQSSKHAPLTEPTPAQQIGCVNTEQESHSDAYVAESKITLPTKASTPSITKETNPMSSVLKLISQTESPQNQTTPHLEQGDEIYHARLPLVGPYGSFIHATDTSLADARERLLKALDQTRILRAAFTDRVYEKYKVILRPVPDSIDSVVDRIRANPFARKMQLMEEIRAIKEEKELEKKEAQKLGGGSGDLNGNGGVSEKHQSPSQASNLETADQLAYVGAGLNLVILPEEDIKGTDIDLAKYPFRGPTNPETGQRTGGISAAAASAAETILYRVRRASLLRNERQRRQVAGPKSNVPLHESKSIKENSRESFDCLPSPAPFSLLSNTSDKPSLQVSSKHAKKQALAKNMASIDLSNKSGRVVNQTVAVGSIFSMNPLAEDLDPRRRPSAATSALLACGVDSKSRKQKWRQPHTLSLGTSGNHMGVQLLPHDPNRGECQSLVFYDREKVTSDRARKALETVLSQFVPSNEAPQIKNHRETHIEGRCAVSNATKSPENKRNRRATEIGLLHGMKHAVHGEGKSTITSMPTTTDSPEITSISPTPTRTFAETLDQCAIEPIVAFSVLQSLGLFHDTQLPHREPSQLVCVRIARATEVADSGGFSRRIRPSNKFLDLRRKVTSRKRSFAEAFACQANLVGSPTKEPCFDKLSLPLGKSSSSIKHDNKNMPNGSHSEHHADIVEVKGREFAHDECLVHSIRGGGGEEFLSRFPSETDLAEGGALNVSSLQRPGSAPGNSSSRASPSSAAGPLSHSMRPSTSDGLFSTLSQNRIGTHGSAMRAFSPQRNAGFTLGAATSAHQGVVNQLQAQALQLQAAAINRLTPSGDLSNFFSAGLHQRQGFSAHADWAAMGNPSQASVNLLQSHSSLTALGLNPHQATMLELSARDRATRAMLAREQQASAVHAAAAVCQVSALRTAASLPGLSGHHGADLFSMSSTSRFGQLSGHSAASAAAFLSSPASAALIGQAQLSVAAIPTHLGLPQHPESRPNSAHSLSSNKSGRGKQSLSNTRREIKEDFLLHDTDVDSTVKSQVVHREKHSSTKRKLSDIGSTSQVNQKGNDNIQSDEKHLNASCDEKVIPTPKSVQESPPRKKLVKTPVREEKLVDIGKERNPCATNDASSILPLNVDFPIALHDGHVSPQATTGLQFCQPPIPAILDNELAACVLDGRIHCALATLFMPSGALRSIVSTSTLLDYIMAVGSAIPIPKALVTHPLKERLNVQSLKSSTSHNHAPSIPREVVAAIILVWLWVQHKDSFQRAFAKSGRIDVDPECKWLIQAAVDAAYRALVTELTEALQNSGPWASTFSSSRSKGNTGPSKSMSYDSEKQASASIAVDARVALIVSEALMTELCIDEELDVVLPIYEDLVLLLDETRLLALKAKCRERVLLAAVIARQVTMSESFGDAYVSSMVRAGEALDHGDLFEMVQDEETSTSTMIPYDIFSDETRAWEDPCRPANGFTSNMTGEDLVRRAHARAVIVKSLKKMQDHNNINGGTRDSGPYGESAHQPPGKVFLEGKAPLRSQNTSSKRRATFSLSDQTVRAGGGSSQAISIQYNPHHISMPLFWDVSLIENMPYGKHSFALRSASGALNSQELDSMEQNVTSISTNVAFHRASSDNINSLGILRRSTEEVAWADVAKAFATVDLAVGATNSRRRSSKVIPTFLGQPRNQTTKTIFAPFCNKIDESLVGSEESDLGEEDITDETILRRHQFVLDDMKARLDKFMEGHTTAGQRARQRAQARSAEA